MLSAKAMSRIQRDLESFFRGFFLQFSKIEFFILFGKLVPRFHGDDPRLRGGRLCGDDKCVVLTAELVLVEKVIKNCSIR